MRATEENSEVGLFLLKNTSAQLFIKHTFNTCGNVCGVIFRKILDHSKLLRNTRKRKNNTFMITTDRNGGYSINKFDIWPGKKLRSTESATYLLHICHRCFFCQWLLIHTNNFHVMTENTLNHRMNSKPEMAVVCACADILLRCFPYLIFYSINSCDRHVGI